MAIAVEEKHPEGLEDPITFSIIMSRLESIAAEMMATVERTAWTPILALARDFSCAIYDAQGRQISMGDALPVHTTSMDLIIDSVNKTFSGDVSDGDVFMTNHPYRGNTHAADLVTLTPVFHGDRLMFWTVTKGHQLDVGAGTPAGDPFTARSVWEEGIHVPPIKVVANGVRRNDVFDLFLSNIRYPELTRGDILAQLGSIERGKVRLVELIDEYGAAMVLRNTDRILDYTHGRMEQEIDAIPDGVYSGETWIDSDGAGRTNVRIEAEVTVSGSDVTVDFGGSDVQSRSGANGTLATSLASAATPILCCIDPEMPKNEGCFRHIRTIVTPGSICRAEYPASTALATTVPADAMQDAVHRALAVAVPERASAGGARAHNEPQFSGIYSDTSETWSTMLFNGTGGAGASAQADGWPMYISPGVMGGEKSPPIEQIELLYPIRFDQVEIEPDSMGLGRFIGGPGIRQVVRPLDAPLECVTSGDGTLNPPHGVLGGTPGAGGGQYLEQVETGERVFISPMGHFWVDVDQRWIGVSSGGGGYGDPVERPIDAVLEDVRSGFVSRERAAAHFGVVLSDDLDAVDETGTSELRARLRGGTGDGRDRSVQDCVTPTIPEAARWLEANKKASETYLESPMLGAEDSQGLGSQHAFN